MTMTGKPGDAGKAKAGQRFATAAQQNADPAVRTFTMEDLLEPGGRGAARAAVLHGNQSAATALADLARAVRTLEADHRHTDTT